MTNPRVLVLLLTLLVTVSFALFAQNEAPGSELSALDELLASGDRAFLTELDRVISTTLSVSAAQQVLRRYLEHPGAGSFLGEIARRKAELYELGGDFESGRDILRALDDATLYGGAEPLSVDLARLEFEVGDIASAEERLGRMTGRQVTRGTLRQITILRCRISLARNHKSSFDSCIATLEGEGWRDMALALSLQWARAQGDEAEAARLSAALRSEFPLVWQSLTATDSRVSRYPSPALILSGTLDVPEATPEVRTEGAGDTPAGQNTAPLGVQVGSFRDRENAEYMARDVGELGFSVSIRSRERNNGTFYQVLVSPGDTTPQNTVVRLKEHGLEGFLVFD